MILATALPLFSAPIDETTANHYAKTFWQKNHIAGVINGTVIFQTAEEACFVNYSNHAGYTEFYIFNNTAGKGFVIISANDCVKPILGYSYDNNISIDNMPPNLKSWLDNYAQQIRFAISTRAEASIEVQTEWQCLREDKPMPLRSEMAVEPLVATIWDQGEYYNLLCPADSNGPGNHAWAGCGATAIAQIMRYWNAPITGTGSHSYTPSSHPEYGTQSANFGATTYNWSNMPLQLTASSTSTQKNAVATLIYHCGVALNMDYGPDGSGSNTSDTEYALQNYFNYPTADYVSRYDNESQWITLLKTQLNSSHPMFYRGSNGIYNGHAFVCDGYDNNDMFHFNWGWSGSYNGFFSINSLTPGNHYFNSLQGAIINIVPNSTGPTYTINASVNPSNSGTITGTGSFINGQTCTLRATANTGYTFVNWTKNGTQVSTEPAYSFSVTGNETYVAHFQPKSYTITTEANPNNSGTINGGGTYTYGQNCTLSATGINGYGFVNWAKSIPTMQYCGDNYNSGAIGLDSGTINWGILFTTDQLSLYNGQNLVSVSLYVRNGSTGNYTFNIYQGGTAAPSTLVSTKTINLTGNGSWHTVDLNSPVSIDVSQSLWITVSATDISYPAAYCNYVGEPNSDFMCLSNGSWQHALDFGFNSSWMIRGLLENTEVIVSSNNPYSFIVSEEANYVAHFQTQSYSITATAEPSDAGSVSGGGNFTYGQTCNLTATANTGYVFANWTKNGTQVSTNPNYSFVVTESASYVAHFQEQSYTITATANPTNGGAVSGGGNFTYGQTCNLTATANTGYDFVKWTKNGTQVSTNPNYSFTVTGNAAYVAHFQAQSYTITATVDPNNGGSVIGAGNYNYGQTCNLTATANPGYSFVNWTKNGVQVSTNTNYSFTVTENATYVAHFQEQSYTITATADPNDGGSVSGGGVFNYGQTCNLTATANTGYVFANWTKNGTQVSTNANYSFVVTESASYVAHFQEQSYTITATANPTNGGAASGGGNFTYGQTCNLTATANTGYDFVKWTRNGTQVSTNPNYSFTVIENATYVAHFQAQSYTINATADPNDGGSVNGSGNYTYGQTCILTATSNTSYTFVNWTENGAQVSSSPSYTFTVTSSRNLIAHFAQNTFVITATAGPNGNINPSGNVVVVDGGNQSFEIIPNVGYEVFEVLVDGVLVGSPSFYSFNNITEDHTISVTFSEAVGIRENDEMQVSIYPNPTKDFVTVHCVGGMQIQIYNVFGVMVKRIETVDDCTQINMSDCPSGMYMMQIIQGNRIKTQAFTKE